MLRKIYSTKINTVANFAGSILPALLSLIFTPLYIHYIGIESYGLIGVLNSILAFLVLFDFGLSPTFNRELARLSENESDAQVMLDTKTTLERINFITAIVVSLCFLATVPLLTHYWINAKNLSDRTVMIALSIMSITFALQFIVNFYIGGLMGLQRQMVLGVVNSVFGAFKFIGAFLLLVYYSPSIQVFLGWQALTILLQAAALSVILKYSLPETPEKGRFSKTLLKKNSRFAAGMMGITISGVILTQTDKVILSKMVSLESFGYYNLAVTVSTMAIFLFSNSISQAVYPKFSKLVAAGDENGLKDLYHHSCQVVSVLLFSIVTMLALFSREVLYVWTGNEVIVNNTSVLLSLIAIGTGLNGLMWLPYFLQLAHGWTKLIFYMNLAAIVILIPLMIYGIQHYGAIGGAIGWLVLNASYVLVRIQLMHRRILKGQQWKWYFEDLLLPGVGAFAVAITGKLLLSPATSRFETFIWLSIISILTLAAAALLTRATRGYLKLGKLIS